MWMVCMQSFVRMAEMADIDSLARLQVDTWRVAYKDILPTQYLNALSVFQKTESWRRCLGNSDMMTHVGVCSDTIAGFVRAEFPVTHKADCAVCELNAMYVHPNFWAQGIGKQLMNAVLNEAQNKRFKKIFLWVFEENVRGRTFYQRRGFYYANETQTKQYGDKVAKQIKYERAL